VKKVDRIKYGRTNYNAAVTEKTYVDLEAVKLAHGFGSHRELQEYFLGLEQKHEPRMYQNAMNILALQAKDK
jgi:heterodisulfide reductase subunit B